MHRLVLAMLARSEPMSEQWIIIGVFSGQYCIATVLLRTNTVAIQYYYLKYGIDTYGYPQYVNNTSMLLVSSQAIRGSTTYFFRISVFFRAK